MAGTGNTTSLEERLRAIEDRLEIYNLIASHPPSADTGADYYTRAVYTEDGVFDRGAGLDGAVGHEAIGAFTLTPAHQKAIAGGIAHLSALPYIELDGDAAFVTSYIQILHPDRESEPRELPNHGTTNGFRVHRVVANRWSLVRTQGGWRIKSRHMEPIDGTQGARDILSQALASYR
ncbi:MAG: nuclear transport factor 2 family protein [Alphaproteobacteria bacterium]